MPADTPCKWCDCSLSRCDTARPNRKCCPDCRHPKRVQRRRTKGWRKPEGAVIVTRGTDWGNPFRVGDQFRIEAQGTPFSPGQWYAYGHDITPEIAVLLFRIWVIGRPGLIEQIRVELGGHDLACWCPLDSPCHADVLLELANGARP
ncbi:hypothetical protein DDJ87_08665 [Mycobacteroides abscessus]|nr:DUF4326 domain-containing protein [Mycobacteroides abscessus]PVA66191.1 hypothetical protein DDJ87_08665 [Mycobacteroides abscessus]